MRLIGMLDSPYVRRVAISMTLMEIPFEHQSLSVFSNFDAFAAINPVVKAPTLVIDDGTVLFDSTLILDVLERQGSGSRSLNPSNIGHFVVSQRMIGLALGACEKTVQIVYETKLRPAEKQHAPWLDRVGQQLLAAYRLLETEFAGRMDWRFGNRPLQADITAAVAWRFTKEVLPGTVSLPDHPALEALSRRAEMLPEFLAMPFD